MKKKGIILVLSILISLLFVELISYLFLHFSDELKFQEPYFNRQLAGAYIYKNSPGFRYNTIKKNINEKDVVIDDFGFISVNRLKKKKAKNLIRIFITGGSAAFGNGQSKPYDMIKKYPSGVYSYESSISGKLLNILKNKHPDLNFEIVNTCSSGRKLNQSITLYLQIIKDFNPDIIVTIDGNNDLETIAGINPFMFDEYYLQKKYIQLHNQSIAFEKQTIFNTEKLIRHLNLFRFIKRSEKLNNKSLLKLLKYNPGNYCEKDYECIKNKLITSSETFSNLILYYNALCKVNNTKFIFCLQPMLYRTLNKELTKTETKMKNTVNPVNISLSNSELSSEIIKKMEYYGNLVHKFFYDDFLTKKINNLGIENDFIYVDFNEHLHAGKYENIEFYTDYCHLTFEANEIVAGILSKEIDILITEKHPTEK